MLCILHFIDSWEIINTLAKLIFILLSSLCCICCIAVGNYEFLASSILDVHTKLRLFWWESFWQLWSSIYRSSHLTHPPRIPLEKIMGALLPFFVEHDFGQPSRLCNEPLQVHLSDSPLLLTDSQMTAVLLILLYCY